MAGWTLVRAGEPIHYEVRAEPGQLLMLPDHQAAELVTAGRVHPQTCPLTVEVPDQRTSEQVVLTPHITVNLPADLVNVQNVIETPQRHVTIQRDADGKISGAEVTDA